MDAILYMHTSASQSFTFDFSNVMPSTDATLNDVGSGSTIDAFKFDGTDVGSTILSSKTRTGLTLKVTLGSLTLGEEYTIRFVGQGTTSSEKKVKTLLVRARTTLEGEF